VYHRRFKAAGKLYPVAQSLATFSVCQSSVPASMEKMTSSDDMARPSCHYRRRVQSEAYPGEIGGIARRLGNEPIFAGDLVQRWSHERVVDGLDALSQITFNGLATHCNSTAAPMTP
jgi:hypothetical protein